MVVCRGDGLEGGGGNRGVWGLRGGRAGGHSISKSLLRGNQGPCDHSISYFASITFPLN